jgi:hypothetical protein
MISTSMVGVNGMNETSNMALSCEFVLVADIRVIDFTNP